MIELPSDMMQKQNIRRAEEMVGWMTSEARCVLIPETAAARICEEIP
jgi:hypothetical protein